MAGVSDRENKDKAVEWINEVYPDRVLDVGAGIGTYAIMAKKPDQHWTALEVFYPYVNMFNLRNLYDEVVISDVRFVDFNKLGRFNLIILADMLEHMTKAEAIKVIEEAQAHTDRLLICFPIVHQDQEAGHEGNDFEGHVDHWTVEEMEEQLRGETYEKVVGDVLAYFMV